MRPGSAALVLWALAAGTAHALSLQVKNRADGTPADTLAFGPVPAAAHRTADPYLEITYPLSSFRHIYLYTDNAVGGGAQEGLVSVTPGGTPIPLLWRAFPGLPQPFDPVSGDLWKPLLDKSSPLFGDPAAKADRALLAPDPAGVSRVGLALQAPADFDGVGDYRTLLVVEEVSDVSDITGPVFGPQPFTDVILTGVSLGVRITAEDDGTVVGSTLYFRMDGAPFQARSTTLTPDLANPFRWAVEAHLAASEVHPGVLEYYFTARDGFENVSQSPVFRANLVTPDTVVSLPMPQNGGRIEVDVGDPLLAGLSLSFPPLSVNGAHTLEVTLESGAGYPPILGVSALRLFDFRPEGLRFNVPVTLAIPYLDMDQDGRVDGTAVDEKILRVFWYDGHDWRFVGGDVDVQANVVRAAISHFSVYALAPLAQALSADMVRPQEKIITPNGDGKNDFVQFNISGGFDIDFFDLRGARVRHLSGQNIWDGRDDNGRPVETGTYLYRLSGQGLTVTGTLAVVR